MGQMQSRTRRVGHLAKHNKVLAYTASHGKVEGADKHPRQTAKRDQQGAWTSEDNQAAMPLPRANDKSSLCGIESSCRFTTNI